MYEWYAFRWCTTFTAIKYLYAIADSRIPVNGGVVLESWVKCAVYVNFMAEFSNYFATLCPDRQCNVAVGATRHKLLQSKPQRATLSMQHCIVVWVWHRNFFCWHKRLLKYILSKKLLKWISEYICIQKITRIDIRIYL